jgi:HEAT repeat protein
MINIKKIFERLRSGTSEQRRSAVSQLHNLPTEEEARAPIDSLMSALNDKDEYIRIGAARALASKRDPAAVPRLAQALGDPSPYARRQIQQALAAMGAAAEQTVLGLLDDPDPLLRGGAIRVIGHMGLRTALARVIEALGDPNEDVRWGAAEALASIGNESAIPALINSLSDEYGLVELYAKKALAALGIPAVRALSGALSADNPAVRLAAIDVLWRHTEKGPEVVSSLVGGLHNELTEVRRKAARGLERLGDPGAAPYLLAAVDDPDAGVSQAVMFALMVCGDASALPRVLDAWSDPDPQVRHAAARALERIGDETILPEVLEALSSPDGPRRADAIAILAAISGQRMIDRLVGALRDVEPEVRRAAAVALGQLGDSEAVPALATALSDRDPWVRSSAASALASIGDRRAVAALVAALADREGSIRYEVIQALGRIRDATAVAPLLEATADADSLIRATACIALGQIGDASALSRLRELTEDQAPYFEPDVVLSGTTQVGGAAEYALRQVERAQALRTAQFSTYYPKEVRPDTWYGMHAFAYVATAAEQVAAEARRLIAEWEAGHREAEARGLYSVDAGTPVTMTPALEGFQFNPPSQTLLFYEDWHRFDFKLRADAERAGKASNGSLEIRLGWAIIADIDLSIYVQKPGIDPALSLIGTSMGPPAIAAATRAPYRSVFCSYSRRDYHST